MEVVDELLKKIDLYFPKNLSYEDPKYHSSSQIARLLKRREEYLHNELFTHHMNKSLKQVFKGYEVVDWTNLESYNGYEYRILLHHNQPILDDDIELMQKLGGKRLDLFLFISILNKNYYFFVNETILENNASEWIFRYVLQYNKEIQCLIEEMRYLFSMEGYHEITTEIANIIIEDVETELKSKGKVTVFNCLFTDLISIPKESYDSIERTE